jgi:hypothetical protein
VTEPTTYIPEYKCRFNHYKYKPSTGNSKYHTSITGFHNFPLSNFKYFLTLFSKFFSSFAHATCSLSVSRQYLALDEIYHPFRAAIPGNSTLRTIIVRGELLVKDRIFTFYDLQFQRSYTKVTRRKTVYRLQLGGPFGNPIYKLSYSRFTRRY